MIENNNRKIKDRQKRGPRTQTPAISTSAPPSAFPPFPPFLLPPTSLFSCSSSPSCSNSHAICSVVMVTLFWYHAICFMESHISVRISHWASKASFCSSKALAILSAISNILWSSLCVGPQARLDSTHGMQAMDLALGLQKKSVRFPPAWNEVE